MKNLLLILFCFILKKNFAQFTYNDSLFFIRDSTEMYYHRIFIDTNKNSTFYSLVSNFSFNNYDSISYQRSLEYLYAKQLFPHQQFNNNLPKEWIKLEIYKGVTYVYSPNDFYFHYKIQFTDSVFINWNGEGPEAAFIHKFQKKNSNTYVFNLTSESFANTIVTIKFLNKENGIALFQFKKKRAYSKQTLCYYVLMVDVNKMKKLPLLVNFCNNQKQYELEFDKVNYDAIFNQL